MPSISLAQLLPDRHFAQAIRTAYHDRLPLPLTKANYHHTQRLSPTLPHTFARAASAQSLRTLRRAMPKMPHRAATHTSLVVATTGLVELRATPSTSITDGLMGQLRDPALTKVWDRAPLSRSCTACLPLPHTVRSHAQTSSPSASSRQPTIRSSVPIVSSSFDTCLAAHASRMLRLAHSTKPSSVPWASMSGIAQYVAAS